MELISVEIPTFVSPHLFWLVDLKKKSDYEHIIENHLKQCVDKYKELVYDAQVGEFVAVQKNNKFFRAIVKNVLNQGDVLKYMCWLVDVGLMLEVKEVMQIPAEVANIPSLSTQACLNDVVFVDEVLSYQDEKIIRKPTLESSEVVKNHCLNVLRKSDKFRFKCTTVLKDILLGDLFYESSGQWLSLSKLLLDAGQLMVDRKLFNRFIKGDIFEIGNYIYSYQKKYSLNKNFALSFEDLNEDPALKINFYDVVDEDVIESIIQPHRNIESDSETDVKNISLKTKTSEMSEESGWDISSQPLTQGQMALLKLQNIRKQKMTGSCDRSLKGESIKTDSNSETVGKPNNKLEDLLRLRKNYKKIGKNMTDEDKNSSFTTDDISSDFSNLNDKTQSHDLSSSSNEMLSNNQDKTKKETSKISENETDGFSFNMLRNTKSKQPIPSCVKFTPGGACHTIKNRKTSDDSNVESSDKKRNKVKKKTTQNKLAAAVISDNKNFNESTSKTTNQCGNRRNFNTDESTDEGSNIRRLVLEKSTENTEEENKSDTPAKSGLSLSDEEVKKELRIKPKCNCPQCDHFTHDGDFKTKEFVKKVSEPVLKEYNTPPLLVSSGEESKQRWKVIALNSTLYKTKIEQQSAYKLLVHGPTMIAPIKKLADANLHESIYKIMLPLGYSESTRIQSFGWPAIFRNHNVCLVNNQRTGKTMTYLTALASELANRAQAYAEFPKSGGPLAVILCKNSSKCEETFDLLRRILGPGNCKNFKIYLATYPVRHLNTSNVDILITLPTVLLHLLVINATNFKRLCHFVIDDADVLLKKWQSTVDKILNVVEQMLSHRTVVRTVQMIVCSVHWNRYVEKCLQKLYSQPMICIGNAFEAAMYGRVDFVIRFLSSACKELELKQILKETYTVYKTVLICKNDELQDVETMLSLRGINALVIYDSMDKEEILGMEELWNRFNGGEFKVLVCTDHVLLTYLTISDAVNLIHYSLPQTWSAFTKRFNVFNDSIDSPLIDKNKKYLLKSYVLTDESCSTELTRFLHHLKETEIAFPPILQQYYDDIVSKSEKEKIEQCIPLCTYFCTFGEKCRNFKCAFRHTVDKNLDTKFCTSLLSKGKIQLKLVEILDVNHFQGQIISHFDAVSNVTTKFNEYESISDNLTEFMKKKQLLSIGRIILNELYAYKDDENGKYIRCICVSLNTSDSAEIRLLDQPKRFITSKHNLYDLPDEFKRLPNFLVDLYLSNFVPPFGDETFSTRSFKYLETILKGYDYKNVIFTADITLTLHNILFLKNVALQAPIDELIVEKFNLCGKIKEEKLAEFNELHMKNLYRACKKADIELPNYLEENNFVLKKINGCDQVKPRWAFLDEERPNEVIFSSAISPNEFYVRIRKFDNLLVKLSREVEEAIKKPSYHRPFTPTIGKFYAVRDINDDYSRVQILNIMNEKALCMFVDYGDEIVVNFKELVYLSNYFIEKLPFQAIKCSLFGIKPVIEGWCETATKILYDFGFQPETDIYRNLFAKVVSKKKKFEYGQNYYEIMLKDSFGDRRVLINELIVECGLADLVGEELKDFELPEMQKIDYDSSSDDEENRMLDIYGINGHNKKTNTEKINVDDQHTNGENNYFDEKNNFYVDNIDDFEFCTNDPSEFLKDLMGNNKENKNLPQIKETAEIPKKKADADIQNMSAKKDNVTADLFQNFCNPTVKWSQTDDFIKMNILLTDCEEYKVNLSMRRHFCFKTTVNDKLYQLTLILFDVVDSLQHTAFGSHIRVTLKKIKPVEWPRLTLKKERYSNIQYDISYLKETNNKGKKILQLPKELDQPEEDDGSDIDMMYLVDSDQESDYDQEINDSD